MGIATEISRAAAWPQLAEYAAHASGRPQIVVERAANYVPEFGDLNPAQARKLVGTVEDILVRGNGTYRVPLHSTDAFYAPSMLDQGFTWQRWRDPVDGFEPYEDKLREWGALGSGERSEDFLFTAVADYGRRGTLGQSINLQSAMSRRGYFMKSGTTGYGNTTLTFDPRSLANATILSGVTVLGLHGSKAGTIEHLPALIASRLAAEAGYMPETELTGLQLLDKPSYTATRIAEMTELRAQLAATLAAGRDDRMAGINSLYFQRIVHSGNPVEAHIRHLTPGDVIRVDIEPPQITAWEPAGDTGSPLRRLSVLDGRTTRVDGLVDPERLDLIEAAAARHNIPVAGLPQQRAIHAESMALQARYGADRVTVKLASAAAPSSTAIGTASLRRRMNAARAALAQAATAAPTT